MLGYVYTYGSVALALGRLAALLHNFDDAEAHFETALTANRRIRATNWFAHRQYELATMLLARGEADDHERAGELLASARQKAETLGLVRLKRKLESLSVGEEPATSGAAIAAAFASPSAEAAFDSRPRAALHTRLGNGDDIQTVVDSAISRARDLSAHASVEGTITILFSDIEDSSSLYEKLGDLRAHQVVRIHNEIFRQQVAAYHGHEVKNAGDSFMIAFSSARRGTQCAIAVQRSLAAYCESHPELPIRVRMGLHVGEAINESSDFFGKAVILAARIATLAQGGQILVSSTLHDLAANAGDLNFTPMGTRELKGLAGTHQIFEVVWSG
jgi:class 3 adenylate cyclase